MIENLSKTTIITNKGEMSTHRDFPLVNRRNTSSQILMMFFELREPLQILRSEVFTSFPTAKFYNKNEIMPERLAMQEDNSLQCFSMCESSNDEIIDFFSSLKCLNFVEQEISIQEES